MGVFKRKDSPWYWLCLERPGKKPLRMGTNILKTDENRALAEQTYQARMAHLSTRSHLPESKRPRWSPVIMVGRWCYIYFVSDGTAIKIGQASNIIKRIGAMQTSHVKPLKLLASVQGHSSIEKHLHMRFRHLRITGEWFKAEPELMEFIERVAKGSDPVVRELLES